MKRKLFHAVIVLLTICLLAAGAVRVNSQEGGYQLASFVLSGCGGVGSEVLESGPYQLTGAVQPTEGGGPSELTAGPYTLRGEFTDQNPCRASRPQAPYQLFLPSVYQSRPR